MAKYRIVKYEYPNGDVTYEAQKKILGLFWWNFENFDSETNGFHYSLEKAKMAIKMDRKDLHKKTIINVGQI